MVSRQYLLDVKRRSDGLTRAEGKAVLVNSSRHGPVALSHLLPMCGLNSTRTLAQFLQPAPIAAEVCIARTGGLLNRMLRIRSCARGDPKSCASTLPKTALPTCCKIASCSWCTLASPASKSQETAILSDVAHLLQVLLHCSFLYAY